MISDSLYAPIIAASGALVVAFLNSIVAEIYRRHRDRRALAAAIAGELLSYEPAQPLIRQALLRTIEQIERGVRDAVLFRPFEKPKDFVFEKAVERLGLLGPKLVEDVVYVYGNINAFRSSLVLISNHFKEMSDLELKARCTACIEALDRATERGRPLITALKSAAESGYTRRLISQLMQITRKAVSGIPFNRRHF